VSEAPPAPVAATRAQPDLSVSLSEHHSDAFGWALACTRWDRSEAEDVLQMTYLKLLEGRARFAGRSSFKTWLFGVIRTTAAERRRKQRRRQRLWGRHAAEANQPLEQPPDVSPDAQRLRRELAALPDRQREVLHLVFYGDLSIAEAADVMGVRLGTARTHYERAKQGLRRRLGIEDEA
jgi:RNA polymerase sigma-70 factor (ECF subfamily)